MRKIIGVSIVMVMSVVVISGCGQTDDEQLSIMGIQEDTDEEMLHEQVMPIGEQVLPIGEDRENIVAEDEMATGHTGSVKTAENEGENVAVESDKNEAEDDAMKAAAECIASGKIYSAMMGECFENNTAPSDSDKKLEINDDDSDISRAAKECINDGGLFNSQLQECFK